MKNTTILVLIGIVLFLAGGFIFVKGGNGNSVITGNVVAQDPQGLQGETQKVTLGMKNLNYYPKEVRVKKNVPVEITLDESVKGCLRSFAIRDIGVSGYAKTPNEKIIAKFTENGIHTATCSMGMGSMKFIVE